MRTNGIVSSGAKSVRSAEYLVIRCYGCRGSPSHGLEDRLSEVISGHDNVSGIVRAAPRKDRMNLLSGFPLLQRPVTQVDKKLHIRELHLLTHHTEGKWSMFFNNWKKRKMIIINITLGKTLLPTPARKCIITESLLNIITSQWKDEWMEYKKKIQPFNIKWWIKGLRDYKC